MNTHCCRLTGVVSLGSSYSFHSEGPGASAVEGTPIETQNKGQAIDIRMPEVQSERVAHQVALQVGPTTYPNVQDMPQGVETGQPTQIELATPHAGQAEPQGRTEDPDPAAVFTWSAAMRTIRHQPPPRDHSRGAAADPLVCCSFGLLHFCWGRTERHLQHWELPAVAA